jgi:hydrogenase expression/formation protein HypE
MIASADSHFTKIGRDGGQLVNDAEITCPFPITKYPVVLMAHGGGGALTQELIEKMFLPAFGATNLAELHDGAVVKTKGDRLAISTDSFVVSPLFFPGGDIGELAVNGTVNDLAMCGAQPQYLTLGFILEEGLSMEVLWQVVRSVTRAADRAGVSIVTGDTKVVERTKGDGLYINTSGIGFVPDGIDISPRRVRPGDVIVISGAIAMHGITIMSMREGLEFETLLKSDTTALADLVGRVLSSLGSSVHLLRDPTRGGVASALNEIASSAAVGIEIDEAAIPISPEVVGACEILGLDPLYVANEGKVLAIVAPDYAEEACSLMREDPRGAEAAVVGRVVDEHPGRVSLRSRVGGRRMLDLFSNELLPRIC